jgi:hypothetical protein
MLEEMVVGTSKLRTVITYYINMSRFKIKKNEDGGTSYNFRPYSIDLSLLWTIIAIAISWATNKSIGWAIFHSMCGIIYIIYWALTGDNANEAGIHEIFNYWKTLFS